MSEAVETCRGICDNIAQLIGNVNSVNIRLT